MVELAGVLQGLLELPGHALLHPQGLLDPLELRQGFGLLSHQGLALLEPRLGLLLQLLEPRLGLG